MHQRIQFLDFFRGIAIFLVITVHASQKYSYNFTALDSFFNLGRYGVQLFFIVSAYTMCLLWENGAGDSNATLNFYVRRFFRIAPLFWIAVILNVSVNFQNTPDQLRNAILTSTFLSEFSPTAIGSTVPGGWSIVTEIYFYLLFPFIIKILGGSRIAYLKTFLIMSLAYIIVLRSLFILALKGMHLPSVAIGDFVYMNIFSQLPVFLLGCYLFFLIRDKKKLSEEKFLVPIFIFFLLAGFLFPPLHFPAICLFLLGIIYLVIKYKVNTSFLEIIGRYSYGIYLTHVFSMMFLYSFIPKDLGLAGLFLFIFAILILSLLLSVALYFFIESKIHNFVDKYFLFKSK
jgi:exopolysaccharide production protein ExoZ